MDLDATTSKDAQSTGACNFSNCPNGCCLGDGTCFVAYEAADGSTDIPCGWSGEACTTCPSGYTCFVGGCMHETTGDCSPANCNGCCFNASMNGGPGITIGGSNECFEGSQDLYCGSGGAACQECAPSMNGGHCVADPGGGGHCEGVGICNATNCVGCCDGNVCAEGTQNVACGIAGAPCQDCSADGGLCLDGYVVDGGLNQPPVSSRACGYGCLVPNGSPPVPCDVYCTSATDCTD